MVFTVLLVLIPVSAALKYLVGASPLLVFASSALAIAVLAEWVRRATDQLADRVGPAIGGLLTVSFGSIAELVLALFVLLRGEVGRVASLDIRRGKGLCRPAFTLCSLGGAQSRPRVAGSAHGRSRRRQTQSPCGARAWPRSPGWSAAPC